MLRNYVHKKFNIDSADSVEFLHSNITIVNGVPVPATCGSLFHSILCSFSEQKDKFCTWLKLADKTQDYYRKYAGYEEWTRLYYKPGIEIFEKKVQYSVHTLTKVGKKEYGYRLHELGMCIYTFKDGAVLHTGGKFIKKKGMGYSLEFDDGKEMQAKITGLVLTRQQYKYLLTHKVINSSGELIGKNTVVSAKKKIAEMESQIEMFNQEKEAKAKMLTTEIQKDYD